MIFLCSCSCLLPQTVMVQTSYCIENHDSTPQTMFIYHCLILPQHQCYFLFTFLVHTAFSFPTVFGGFYLVILSWCLFCILFWFISLMPVSSVSKSLLKSMSLLFCALINALYTVQYNLGDIKKKCVSVDLHRNITFEFCPYWVHFYRIYCIYAWPAQRFKKKPIKSF